MTDVARKAVLLDTADLLGALAEEVHDFLYYPQGEGGMPEAWWYRACLGSKELPDDESDYFISEKNRVRIRDEEAKAARGEFSYSFRRTFDHVPTCNCPVCDAKKAFADRELLYQVGRATDIADLKAPKLMFASHFGDGDFLATHTDKDNGRVAFVWNLTKNWRPQYGGLLHLLDDNWQDTKTVVFPRFNELVLFDVRGEGWPHFVSRVIPGVAERRLAISGWFT